MSTKRIRFTVTQEHIDKGRKARDERELPFSTSCPVALALVARTGEREWAVCSTNAFATRTDPPCPDYTPSRRTVTFLRAFDDGQPVEPFTGEVYL